MLPHLPEVPHLHVNRPLGYVHTVADSSCADTKTMPIWTPVLTLLTPRVSSGKLSSGAAKIWLFGPNSACSFIQPKLFASSISTSSPKFCAASELELKKLTKPLKNFQVTKALVLAAQKIPLNVHKCEIWNLHTLDSWLNICVDYFTRRYVKPKWLVR